MFTIVISKVTEDDVGDNSSGNIMLIGSFSTREEAEEKMKRAIDDNEVRYFVFSDYFDKGDPLIQDTELEVSDSNYYDMLDNKEHKSLWVDAWFKDEFEDEEEGYDVEATHVADVYVTRINLLIPDATEI